VRRQDLELYQRSVSDIEAGIHTAIEGVLIWGSSIVGNLYSSSSLRRVLEEIDVRALIESVVWRLRCRGSVVVM
jgi:hypothetical protein